MKKPPESKSERTLLSPQELDAMMPPGEYVHTLIGSGMMLFGAAWKRTEILEAAKRGAELSGKLATAMNHGALIWKEDKTPVFVETIRKETS